MLPIIMYMFVVADPGRFVRLAHAGRAVAAHSDGLREHRGHRHRRLRHGDVPHPALTAVLGRAAGWPGRADAEKDVPVPVPVLVESEEEPEEAGRTR